VVLRGFARRLSQFMSTRPSTIDPMTMQVTHRWSRLPTMAIPQPPPFGAPRRSSSVMAVLHSTEVEITVGRVRSLGNRGWFSGI
jgi:hypothetical protein